MPEQEPQLDEPLALITEDGLEPSEYPLPETIAASNPVKLVTVECSICGAIIEIPLYNSSRSDALIEHIRKEHPRHISGGFQVSVVHQHMESWLRRND